MTTCKDTSGKLDQLNRELINKIKNLENRVAKLEARNKANNSNNLDSLIKRIERIEKYIQLLDDAGRKFNQVVQEFGTVLISFIKLTGKGFLDSLIRR